MKILTDVLIYVLVIFVDILYYVNLHNTMNLISEKTRFKKISYVLAVTGTAVRMYVLYFPTSIVPLPENVGGILTMGCTLIFFITLYLSHRGQLLKTAYVTFLYFALEACAGAGLNIISYHFIPDGYMALSERVVYLICNLTYYFVLTKVLAPGKEDLNLSLEFIDRKTYAFIGLYACFLGQMIAYVSAAIRHDFTIGEVLHNMRFFVIPICILSFVIITMLIMNSMSKFYYKRSAELLDKQLDMQAKYYEKIGEISTDIRKFRHDYKNHMHCLKTLLDSEKTDEALEYLESISSNPTMNVTSFKSGNTIADAILNDKAAIAAQENFRLNFSGVISEKVSAFDICTILSNALDNSIEACRRLKQGEERYIDVNCVLKNDMQMISISNPSNTSDPDLKTSKANKKDHGFGLYNIKKAVDALDGTVSISQTSPVFVLDVMFKVDMAESA